MYIFLYLLQVSACLLCFYLLYVILYKKDTFYQFNRFYLVTGLILSFVIPLLEIEQASVKEISTIIQEPLNNFVAGSTEVSAPVVSESQFNWKNLLFSIYLIGVTFFIIKLIYQIGRLIAFIRKGKVHQVNRYAVIYTDGEYPTSSFFHYILWDNQVKDYSELEKESIIGHEMTHIRQMHTLDNLLMELVKIILWFNPIVYFYNASLKLTHEFLADKRVLSNPNESNIADYKSLINKQLLNNMGYQLTNNFNMSNLKNRMIMITKPKTRKIALVKSLIILPLLAGLLITCSNHSNFSKNSKSYVYDQNNNRVLTHEVKDGEIIRHSKGIKNSQQNDSAKSLYNTGHSSKEFIYTSYNEKRTISHMVDKILINGKEYEDINLVNATGEISLKGYAQIGDLVEVEIFQKTPSTTIHVAQLIDEKGVTIKDLGILSLKGVYQGKSIYIQNPFDSDGRFTTKKIVINDKNYLTKGMANSAFEIDLGRFFKEGDSLGILIYHHKDFPAKILNPEAIQKKL